jgi:hypothetical protein
MRASRIFSPGKLALAAPLLLVSCSAFQRATEPVGPVASTAATANSIPDSALRNAIRKAELVVLATPMALASQHGFLTPQFQMGARETWYDVKLQVDSVVKGKLKRAKRPDLGMLPAALTPPPAFRGLQANQIVVQYPAVTSSRSNWAGAPPLIPGEAAIFMFRRCYYCLQIGGVANPRGPYYTANPLVAMGPVSKLPPGEWSRVVRLASEER